MQCVENQHPSRKAVLCSNPAYTRHVPVARHSAPHRAQSQSPRVPTCSDSHSHSSSSGASSTQSTPSSLVRLRSPSGSGVGLERAVTTRNLQLSLTSQTETHTESYSFYQRAYACAEKASRTQALVRARSFAGNERSATRPGPGGVVARNLARRQCPC